MLCGILGRTFGSLSVEKRNLEDHKLEIHNVKGKQTKFENSHLIQSITMKLTMVLLLGVAFMSILSGSQAARDDDLKPRAQPAGTPADVPAADAPVEAPVLPSDSTGVPSVAAAAPDPVPGTPPPGGEEDVYIPPDPSTFLDGAVPWSLDPAAGERWTFSSWKDSEMDWFFGKLMKHGMIDSFMGLLESVVDKGVYESFAKAYTTAETFSRRAQALSAMNRELLRMRKDYMEKYGGLGLSEAALERGWLVLRKEVFAKWKGVILDGVTEFEKVARKAYMTMMGGAACSCLLNGVCRRHAGGDSDEDDSDYEEHGGRRNRKRGRISARDFERMDEGEDEEDQEEEEEEDSKPPAKKPRKDHSDDEGSEAGDTVSH